MKEFIISVSILAILVLLLDTLIEYDSTDDLANGKRSGLGLYTDHETGCQYLSAGLFSGITPRLNHLGNKVGCQP